MDNTELYSRTRENIKQALEDYGKHTYDTRVLERITDSFIDRLAEDSIKAKQELRELFSKSPVWDAELDALVINGTRTHNPDIDLIQSLAGTILYPAIAGSDPERANLIRDTIRLFTFPDDDYYKNRAIEAINILAPKAYTPTKKPSRVFKSLCDALGVTDDTAGSDFQRLFAQFADELTAKKIGFKLYASINPAHFLTMSNPKGDSRGATLTSCHSLNSTEYTYNCGCSGYARDKVTFIVFTVSDPRDPETFNNRKTTRQIFAYKPGNGLLLQSRLYNTSGGTRGAQEESKLYRDLIQREISALEDAANLWKTYKCCGENHSNDVETGCGFGGYPDWQYSDFDAKVSIRTDHIDDYRYLTVGTYGLCTECGDEISEGLYCDDCKHNCDDEYYCDHCEEYHSSTNTAYDYRGNEVNVCDFCLDEHYTLCDRCNEYHHDDCITRVADGTWVCDSCLDEYYTRCDECDEYYSNYDIRSAIDSRGNEIDVCEHCLDEYCICPDCDSYVHPDYMFTAYDESGSIISVCGDCLDEHYTKCDECGEYHPTSLVEDGLCPKCRAEKEKEETA